MSTPHAAAPSSRPRWSPLALIAALSLALGCSGQQAPAIPEPAEDAASAAAPAPGDEPEQRTVTVVAINDFHGALYEQSAHGSDEVVLGGLPWLAGAVAELRREAPDLVLLDGGDLFQGSWPVNVSQGMGSVEVFELLGVDAAAIGNHEFDYGPSPAGGHPLRGALYEAIEAASHQWLAANIRERDPMGALHPWRPPGLSPWTVIERNGVRLGVIGLTTTETPTTTLFQNVADLVFDDPVETVRALLPELEAENVDAVIVVGHLTGTCAADGSTRLFGTTSSCRAQGEIGRLIDELPPGAIDLIIAGHEHIVVADRARDTLVVEAMSHGRALVRVDLVIGLDGVDADASVIHEPWVLAHAAAEPGCDGGDYPLDPLDVGGRVITPSVEAIALVDRLETRSGSLCEVVGCADVALRRARGEESAVGDLVSDAIAASFVDVDVAIQNSGGLRADVGAGQLRREDLHAVMPFDNRIVLVELSGEELERLFRIGSSGQHGLLQVAGASYRFDPTIETGTDLNGDGAVALWERDRLCWLRVDGRPVDPAATYRVATNDFLYAGGDHLGPIFDGRPLVEEGPLVREQLYDFVASLGVCLGAEGALVNPTAPRIEVGPCDAGD